MGINEATHLNDLVSTRIQNTTAMISITMLPTDAPTIAAILESDS